MVSAPLPDYPCLAAGCLWLVNHYAVTYALYCPALRVGLQHFAHTFGSHYLLRPLLVALPHTLPFNTLPGWIALLLYWLVAAPCHYYVRTCPRCLALVDSWLLPLPCGWLVAPLDGHTRVHPTLRFFLPRCLRGSLYGSATDCARALAVGSAVVRCAVARFTTCRVAGLPVTFSSATF